MRDWRDINNTGRGLVVLSIVNVVCGILLAIDGETASALLSVSVAGFCGISTFRSKYDRFK